MKDSLHVNEVVEAVTKKYAQFTGRARRREYWMYTLINSIITFVLAIPISGVLMGLAMQTDAGMDPSAALTGSTLIFAAIYALYALATFIPSLAIAVRRLHDTGKSGWWLLIGLVPLVGLYLLYLLAQPTGAANEYGGVATGSDAPTVMPPGQQ